MKRTILVAVAVLYSHSAWAEIADYSVAITPFAGYRIGGEFEDSDDVDVVELDEDRSFGLILNLPADDTTEWELYLSRQSAGIERGTLSFGGVPFTVDPNFEIEISYAEAGGTYVFEGDPVRPFIAAGIGVMHADPSSAFDSETFLSLGFGAGVLVFPESPVGLRLEARAHGSLVDSSDAIFCRSDETGAGCAIAIEGDLFWQIEFFAGLVARF